MSSLAARFWTSCAAAADALAYAAARPLCPRNRTSDLRVNGYELPHLSIGFAKRALVGAQQGVTFEADHLVWGGPLSPSKRTWAIASISPVQAARLSCGAVVCIAHDGEPVDRGARSRGVARRFGRSRSHPQADAVFLQSDASACHRDGGDWPQFKRGEKAGKSGKAMQGDVLF
jgi:hypothetical protein